MQLSETKGAYRLILFLSSALIVAGCASTKVTEHQRLVKERLPRPSTILVYDFGATAADLPGGSGLGSQGSPQTREEIENGRKIGTDIAIALVEDIRALGMGARRAMPGTFPQMYDIIIHGYLLSVAEGSAGKRILVGFRSGASELQTAVEASQMTPQGQRQLGFGKLESSGSKTPGMTMGVATFIATGNPAGLIVTSGMRLYGEHSGKNTLEGRADKVAKEIAEVLKKRFQEEGWIAK